MSPNGAMKNNKDLCLRQVSCTHVRLKESMKKYLSQKGMTLIEVLIVLGIIAGVMSLFITGLGGTSSEKMRAEVSRVSSLIRYAYYQAALQNKYYRIAFQLTDQTYTLEYSDTPFYIVKKNDLVEEMIQKNLEEEQDNSDVNEGEEESTSPQSELKGQFSVDEAAYFEQHQLDELVRLSEIYVAHQEESVNEGTAYLYFFPKGFTEFAVIYFSNDDETAYMTLIVNPLTGEVTVESDYLDLEEILKAQGEI